MNILFATDEKFAEICTVAMRSISINDDGVHFFVIQDRVSDFSMSIDLSSANAVLKSFFPTNSLILFTLAMFRLVLNLITPRLCKYFKYSILFYHAI